MRLKVALNGTEQYVASLPGAGFLNAHLNLSDRPKDGVAERVLRLKGFDTNTDTETISIDWKPIELSVGDSVQLEVLEEGPGDTPDKQKSSKETESNLFSNEQLAEELLNLEQDIEKILFQFLAKVEKEETPEEYTNFKRAFGHVLAELGDRFVYPVYRRHARLVPEEMKGELL